VPSEDLLRRYAELAVKVGLNLRSEQDLHIHGQLEHAPLIRAIARVAYELGARTVDVFYADQYVRRATLDHAREEALEWSSPWSLAEIEYLDEKRGAVLAITGDPNPDVFEGVDGRRLAAARPKLLVQKRIDALFVRRTVTW
jgi:aminopeptidase